MRKTYYMDVKGISRVILPNYIDNKARSDLTAPFVIFWVHSLDCEYGADDEFVLSKGVVKVLKY